MTEILHDARVKRNKLHRNKDEPLCQNYQQQNEAEKWNNVIKQLKKNMFRSRMQYWNSYSFKYESIIKIIFKNDVRMFDKKERYRCARKSFEKLIQKYNSICKRYKNGTIL